MYTNNLKRIVTKRKKRVGRGGGSGKGDHTVGKGQKGQTSRAGFSLMRGFEGGQVPIARRLPIKKGFKSRKDEVTSIRISKLLEKNIFEIDRAVLGKLSSGKSLKLVGDGSYEGYDLSKVVVKQDVKLTSALRDKIISSGGRIEEKSA